MMEAAWCFRLRPGEGLCLIRHFQSCCANLASKLFHTASDRHSRDWCSESARVPREVAEACLAHVVTGVEGAYARSDLVDRRRKLMERWAVYLATDAGDTVIPMARSSKETSR